MKYAIKEEFSDAAEITFEFDQTNLSVTIYFDGKPYQTYDAEELIDFLEEAIHTIRWAMWGCQDDSK